MNPPHNQHPSGCFCTFTSQRSAIGLENEREVFRRYKARRAAEREYVPEPLTVGCEP